MSYVCCSCIREIYLQKIIEEKNIMNECSFCGRASFVISIAKISNAVETVISQFFELTPCEPSDYEFALLNDGESNYEWIRPGSPINEIISELVEAEDDVAEEIREYLAEKYSDKYSIELGLEGPFDESSHYINKSIVKNDFLDEWLKFEANIKQRNRFFGLEEVLNKIFDNLEKHQTNNQRRVIVEAGPGTRISEIFRARSVQSINDVEKILSFPEKELGPPPTDLATEGRMNSFGISVFYGALNPEVTLTEVRPPVGARVVVGKFKLKRTLRLLDVEALREVYAKGSLFEPDHFNQVQHAQFLRELSHRISRPILPDDERFDYLATQAIADYLSSKYSLDGILYPSALGYEDRNVNVVLFHQSSKVETAKLKPVKVGIGNYSEEGFEESYWVIPEKTKAKKQKGVTEFEIDDQSFPKDSREDTLWLDRTSLQVHVIKRINIESETFNVSWNNNPHGIDF